MKYEERKFKKDVQCYIKQYLSNNVFNRLNIKILLYWISRTFIQEIHD